MKKDAHAALAVTPGAMLRYEDSFDLE